MQGKTSMQDWDGHRNIPEPVWHDGNFLSQMMSLQAYSGLPGSSSPW